jgi:hypothetical protein
MSIETVFDGNSELVLHVEPTILVRRTLVFVRDGVSVGFLDAQYDFGNLAPEFHELALMLVSPRRTVLLPSVQPAVTPAPAPKPATIWSRIRGKLYG